MPIKRSRWFPWPEQKERGVLASTETVVGIGHEGGKCSAGAEEDGSPRSVRRFSKYYKHRHRNLSKGAKKKPGGAVGKKRLAPEVEVRRRTTIANSPLTQKKTSRVETRYQS